MKINFRNLQKIIVGIILGEIIGVSLCVSELIKINKIKDIGIESRVQRQYEYHEILKIIIIITIFNRMMKEKFGLPIM